jgi:hypothetical protein
MAESNELAENNCGSFESAELVPTLAVSIVEI